MKHFQIIFCLLITFESNGQTKTTEDFGFRHLEYSYNGDKVDILIKSKKGEESNKKPIFFFCQGSLPQPLIKFDEQGVFGVFPFNPDSLTNKFHVVIISKPYIPLIADVKTLGNNFTYMDSLGQFPREYSERNLPDYYVDRNIEIVKFLHKQQWITKKQLIVAGHSEGSTIATLMASKSPLVTHLIYSGGNPMGRIMSIIQQSRASESETDNTPYGEMQMKYWQEVVENKNNVGGSEGDTYKATYEFSKPTLESLENLRIPVLVCYGTKDWSAPFNDYLRVEMIRKGKKNFTFLAYIGTEHNYFPLTTGYKPNFDIFNWDNVAKDWWNWLNEN
jgi:dienelactone hydrolase